MSKSIYLILLLSVLSLHSLSAQGLTPCNFSEPGSSLAKWYPDSKSLIYVYSGEFDAIRRVNLDGSDDQEVIANQEGIGHPMVTSDLSILYQRSHEKTGNKVLILRSANGEERTLTDPAYNCTDGAKHPKQPIIAFAMKDDTGNLDIYSLNYETNDLKRLTTSNDYDYSPHWSPDGTQLIFTSHQEGQPNIYLMNADGSGQVSLTAGPGEEFSAAWSPDGEQIVYSSRKAKAPDGQDAMIKHNSNDLFLLNLKTRKVKQITKNDDMEVLPDWSPDGTNITYTSCDTGHREVYVLNITSGRIQRLTFAGKD